MRISMTNFLPFRSCKILLALFWLVLAAPPSVLAQMEMGIVYISDFTKLNKYKLDCFFHAYELTVILRRFKLRRR